MGGWLLYVVIGVIQGFIVEGKLSMGQAKQLLGLPKEEQQLEVAKAIMESGWSSRIS